MTTTAPTESTTINIDVTTDYLRSFEQMEPIFSAIAEEDCAPINTDIWFAANTAQWAAKKIQPLRASCAEQLPRFDIELFERLEHAAKAAAQAHANYLLASDTANVNKTIAELDVRLNRRRAQFIADIHALAGRGLIDDSKLDELKNPNGFKNLAQGVFALAALLRTNWAAIQGRTAVTAEELAEAQDLAERMNAALTLRERGPEALVPATLARKQAFTLLMQTYDRLTSVVAYLRWGAKDVDQWMPSLFVNQRSRPLTTERTQPQPPTAPGITPIAQPIAEPITAPIPLATPPSPPIGDGLPNSDPLA